jgi:hypothetical protein
MEGLANKISEITKNVSNIGDEFEVISQTFVNSARNSLNNSRNSARSSNHSYDEDTKELNRFNNPVVAKTHTEFDLLEELNDTLSDNPFDELIEDPVDEMSKSKDEDYELSYSKSFPQLKDEFKLHENIQI